MSTRLIADTRIAGLRIVPVCSAVAADVTDPVTPDVLAWLDTVLAADQPRR